MTEATSGLELFVMLPISLPAISSRKLIISPSKTAPEALAPGALALRELLLLRDDLVLDFRVGGLRNDLLAHQVGLLGIRTSVNNLLRIFVADAGHSVQLILGCGVNVQQVGIRGSRHCGIRFMRFGRL